MNTKDVEEYVTTMNTAFSMLIGHLFGREVREDVNILRFELKDRRPSRCRHHLRVVVWIKPKHSIKIVVKTFNANGMISLRTNGSEMAIG